MIIKLIHRSLSVLASLSVVVAEPPTFKEGEITLSITEAKRVTNLRYQKKDSSLRIDRPGRHIPSPPINFLDLNTGRLRILRPHNATWSEIPAEHLKPVKSSPMPQPPPGIGPGANPTAPGTPGNLPPRSKQPQGPLAPKNTGPFPGSGPQLSEGIGPQPNKNTPSTPSNTIGPNLPGVPDIPKSQLPDGIKLPSGIGPESGISSPGLPGMPGGGAFLPPSMPDFASIDKQSMTLTPHQEQRSFHGYLCTRHTLDIPREGIMTLWLTSEADLPPFFPLMYESPYHWGRMAKEHQWTALIREKKLFPMLAILHAEADRQAPGEENKPGDKRPEPESGPELKRWEVTSITPKSINDGQGQLFKIPNEFYRIH